MEFRLPLSLALLVACLPLIGCPVSSQHPLYTERDAVVEPGLEGTWVDPESHDKGEITFQKSGAHEYTMASLEPDSKISQNYKVHLVRLGDQLFMDLIFENQTLNGEALGTPLGIFTAHIIMKVKVSGDDLAYATLEDDAIQKPHSFWGGSPLDYQVTDGNVLVTAQTDDLRRYISDHPDTLFSDSQHLKRKGKAATRP